MATPESTKAAREWLDENVPDDFEHFTVDGWANVRQSLAEWRDAAIAEEREACAGVCQEVALGWAKVSPVNAHIAGPVSGCLDCQTAIRVRTR